MHCKYFQLPCALFTRDLEQEFSSLTELPLALWDNYRN
jgi:hypothetical protein